MKTKLLTLILLVTCAACSAPRVLVKVPCDSAGPGLGNCEKVKDL